LDFYTTVFARGDKVYVRGFDKGMRVTDVVTYSPYMFIPKPDGEYRTLNGRPVAKLDFDSISDARDFVNRYEGVSNMEIFGLDQFLYLYIFDTFKGEINYDPKLLNVVTLDIEVGGEDIAEFPDIDTANQPITAITIKLRNKIACFGVKDFTPKSDNVYYLKCKDEYDLLQKFLQVWESKDWCPDIVTGWNVEFFDIPYLVQRIINLFGEKDAKRMSPWRMIEERRIEIRSKANKTYELRGIATLDYFQLYKKFTFGNQESYRLDFIANIELGENKVDYSEYGSLNDLYKKNFQLYMEYNIHDVLLVDKLDDKLKFIEQVMALAYDAKVNLADTMTTVRPWDIIIHNYLLDQKIVIPQNKKSNLNFSLVGGYVKEPKIGLSRWVVSFDLNSLYPHLIMQYNISPETYMGKKRDFPELEDLLEGNAEAAEQLDIAVAANGCMYSKDKQGFLPALMERMYNDRTKYKKLMLEAKQRYENNPNIEDEKLIARYHNMQMARKIQLNSAYGALGNQYFRWFSFDLAESITMSGQLSIRWIERKMNQYMNKMCKTEGKDYVIASDTDSIYVTFDKLIPEGSDELEAVKLIDQFCEKHVQVYIDKCYDELAGYMNAYQQKMKMKRETIANKGIWKAKKMYILNAWNVEGVQYIEPKLKLQGIEAVRSSTPRACRENIKKALSIIMNGTESELRTFIDNVREDFMTLPFEDIAFPRGVKDLNKYIDRAEIYKKATPIQVKGSLIFNHLLKKHNVKDVQPITNGDKIKFAYLKTPNPIHQTVIATPDVLPAEFNLDKYVDRELQFEKSFMEPLRSITQVIGWKTEQVATLEDFFS